MKRLFELSYPIGTVTWDGHSINKRPDTKINDALDILQECGINMVMITGYHTEEPSAFDMTTETKRIGAELVARGMKAAQHHGLSSSYAQLGTSQEDPVKHLYDCIDYTANLGAEALVLHSGRISGHLASVKQSLDSFEAECAKHSLDAVIECCAENLHKAGIYAEEKGVLIALENVDRFEPLGNIRDLPRLIEMADSPAVGFCLDSGHAHCCGYDIMEWIDVMGDKLFTTHFHDNRGPSDEVLNTTGFIAPKGIDQHLPPGFGTIPWADVITKLLNTGYSHPVNFESGPWPGMPETDGYKAAINYWHTCEYLASAK